MVNQFVDGHYGRMQPPNEVTKSNRILHYMCFPLDSNDPINRLMYKVSLPFSSYRSVDDSTYVGSFVKIE